MEHMRLALQRFKEEGLKLRLIKKCFFGLQEIEYLGYTMSASKIFVSTKKVEAVADWPSPTTEKEVRSFVQFCNFYAKFIHHFSDRTAPLTDLLRKSQPHKVPLTQAPAGGAAAAAPEGCALAGPSAPTSTSTRWALVTP
jgi:hypothetical protein